MRKTSFNFNRKHTEKNFLFISYNLGEDSLFGPLVFIFMWNYCSPLFLVNKKG